MDEGTGLQSRLTAGSNPAGRSMTEPKIQAAREIAAYLRTVDTTNGTSRADTLLQQALAALDPELPPYDDVDISNRFMLGVTGMGTSQPLFNFTLRPSPMTADEALVQAAWLVTLADPLHERFPTIERMVRNT